ncbi:MAG: Fic family protein [Anaerolineaceae bacterium]|nr:Fic family protein [Anaerolineaceae bacterium]
MEPYIPDMLPLEIESFYTPSMLKLISDSSASLSKYNGIMTNPSLDPNIFLSPLEAKEAVLSSRIEGTETTLDDVLLFDADVFSGDREGDIVEVLNYRTAMREARKWLEKGYPINKTVICEIQKSLLQGVRGQNKMPGEIRKEQVWIGARYSTIENAQYVPPAPTNVPNFIDNLLYYMSLDDQEPLIQTAIMHAQFEIIHPFMDGNGRTGRILIPLFLWSKNRLDSPMFYISEYFESNRDQYTQCLHNITAHQDWPGWIQFFLRAIQFQADKNSKKALKITDLYEECKNKLFSVQNSQNSLKGLDILFSMPIFSAAQFRNIAKMTPPTTARVLAAYKQMGFIETISPSSGRKSELLIFPELYRLINE